MGKRLLHTPKSKIKSALRQLSLRSRERAAVVKRDKNTCQICGIKGSKAKGKTVKTIVHHKKSINWEKIFKFIYKELLVSPDKQEVLCEECHNKIHNNKGRKNE